jgi:hypothetical protein
MKWSEFKKEVDAKLKKAELDDIEINHIDLEDTAEAERLDVVILIVAGKPYLQLIVYDMGAPKMMLDEWGIGN